MPKSGQVSPIQLMKQKTHLHTNILNTPQTDKGVPIEAATRQVDQMHQRSASGDCRLNTHGRNPIWAIVKCRGLSTDWPRKRTIEIPTASGEESSQPWQIFVL